MRHMILYRNCLKVTFFQAFSTTDARIGAGFSRHSAFVFVYTGYVNTTRFWPFLPHPDDIFGATFHTGAARRTFVFIYFGNPCCRVDSNGIERTDVDAIAKAKTTIRTTCLAAIKRCHDGATFCAVVEADTRTNIADAIAFDYGNFLFFLIGFLSQNGGYMAHRLAASGRAYQFV